MKVSFSSSVLRGFPIDVEATVERFDNADYTHFGAYQSGRYCVVELEIFQRGKRKCIPFIERQLTDSDWEILHQEAIEAI